jgi:hypothetical protein
MVDLTREHLLAAAQFRAATGVRTLGAGCKTFVTNDRACRPCQACGRFNSRHTSILK